MAFQAGGAHALDRALEAIAYAYDRDDPRRRATAVWEKPGRGAPLRMEKTFTVVPRGVALVIGCNTFPTWNSWPGLFASLVTGNPVDRQAAPAAPCCRSRSPSRSARRCSPRPASTRTWSRSPPRTPPTGWPPRWPSGPRCKLVDFTGGNAFGDWLEENARQADGLHREGRRQHGRHRLDRLVQRRCATTSRSRSRSTPARCARRRRTSTCRPAASRPTRATSRVGRRRGRASARRSTSCSATTRARSSCSAASSTTACSSGSSPPARRGEVCVASREVTHPAFADAAVRTPTLVGLTAADAEVYETECFGPVAYLITTARTDESIDAVPRHGAASTAR